MGGSFGFARPIAAAIPPKRAFHLNHEGDITINSTDRKTTDMEAVDRRLTFAADTATAHEARLRTILANLRGAVPMPVSDKAPPVAFGYLGSMKETLSRLETSAASISGLLDELDTLV